jgi:hypothetical protein
MIVDKEGKMNIPYSIVPTITIVISPMNNPTNNIVVDIIHKSCSTDNPFRPGLDDTLKIVNIIKMDTRPESRNPIDSNDDIDYF